jgi:hypothetical protein
MEERSSRLNPGLAAHFHSQDEQNEPPWFKAESK